MKYLKILLVCLALMPISVLAETKSYEAKNLEEVLIEEGIEADLSNYKETDNQITIYMFRGNGCGYCKNFLTFLSSIVPEYGKYFKLESYEVWYNKNNNKLFKEVAEFLEQDSTGVPFIIIGDQVFPGYASQYDDAIKQTILALYNSSERYDILVEVEKAKEAAEKANRVDLTPVIISSLIFTVLGSGIVIYLMADKNNTLSNKIDSLEAKIIDTNYKLDNLKFSIEDLKATSKDINKKNSSKDNVKNTKTQKNK